MMKKLLILSSIVAFLLTANAQDTRYELSIHAAGGISTLQYKPNVGNKPLGFGGNFGLGYTYFFNDNWGLGTGVEFSLLNSKFDMSGQKYVIQGIDPSSNVPFLLNYSITDFNEKQQAWLVNVPLMLHFQTGKFYAAVGAKVGFPVAANYTTEKGTIETTGFFEDVNWNIPSSGYEHLGFGKYDISGSEGDLSLKTAVMASAEIGAKWRLSDKWALYTGVYVDYGLNNIVGASNKTNFVDITYNATGVHVPSSVLQSQYTDKANGKPTNIVDKVVPLSAGLKLKFGFGGKSAKATPATSEPSNKKELDALNEQMEKQLEAMRKAEQEAEKRWQEMKEMLEGQKESEAASLRPQAVSIVEMPIYGYDFGQTALSMDKKAELDKKVMLMKQYPDMNITCIGHTCNRGTEDANMKVGLQRADAAKAYLMEHGISADRISTESRGSKQPIVPNTSEENRRLNRRVEFKVK
jgi:outer membrane protein OmpA-like peptidoglycan-associated protein